MLDRWSELLIAALQRQDPAVAVAALAGTMFHDSPEGPALTLVLVITLAAAGMDEIFAPETPQAHQARALWRLAALVATDVLMIETTQRRKPAQMADLTALWQRGEGATPRPN